MNLFRVTGATIIVISEWRKIPTNNSGVLLVNGTTTGTITYKRGGLLANKWSIVTSPVSGQTVKTFAENVANNIRINTTPDPDRYAIGYYDDSQTSGSKWQYYDANVSAVTEFIAGQSYAISRATDGEVSFTGTLAVNDLVKTVEANKWNAIGNPFTTYYPANKNSNSSFLNDNACKHNKNKLSLLCLSIELLQLSLLTSIELSAILPLHKTQMLWLTSNHRH